VSKTIDSDALQTLQRLLGMAGLLSGVTELDTENLTQVIDVGPIIRRSRALSGTDGVTFAIMENVHGGATSEASSLDPYEPGTVVARAPYPSSVPEGFDFWLLAVTGITTANTGLLTPPAILSVVQPAAAIGLAVDDAGAAPATLGGNMQVVHFDTELGGFFMTEAGQPYAPIGLRLIRGTTLTFNTTSSAAATYQLRLICALLPGGLGQDVVTG